MKSITLVTLALTTLLSLGFSTQAQNLLTNASFEAPAHPTNSITQLSAGSPALPGWTINGNGTVFLVSTPLTGWSFLSQDGQQFLDFNDPAVNLSQSFNTVPGQSYEVTFFGGYFQGNTNMVILAQALATNGAVLGSFALAVPPPSGWKPAAQFRFTASDSTTTLQFRGSNATVNIDLAFDNVSVLPVTPALTINVSQVRLCWQSQTNRLYQLQYRSDLTTNIWTDLGAPIPGTGNDCSLQPVTDPRRFYRVILLL